MCSNALTSPSNPAPAKAPDTHLALRLDGPCRNPRQLVGALLRVDLGARISVEPQSGHVHMEGRFWKHEVIAAIERQGYRLRGWEERPLSSRVMPGALAA